uniref:Amino acid transporter transmembrane domain-containing protein n=1 Tax=Nelumbo nucifera TaxID=4432 RepID=A0A822XKF1_NELNU|nr:TPA_asm: hypothetical protein HUJ06_021656 [Nelumbo nucifera]
MRQYVNSPLFKHFRNTKTNLFPFYSLIPSTLYSTPASHFECWLHPAQYRTRLCKWEKTDQSMFNVKRHGGSIYDAWFSCASNQVAQVLLTLPYSFSQLGMLSGILFQIFYGLVGNWTAYLISVLYIEYRSRKEKVNVSFKNHVIQWFEVLDRLLGPYWKAVGLAFNCTFLLFGSVIQLIYSLRKQHILHKRPTG